MKKDAELKTLHFVMQSDPPPPKKETDVVACHLLVKVLWVTGFTHFTS